MAYEVRGTGQPVVLVHGHPFNRSMWGAQVAFLACSYQVITYDLRGYGQSSGASTLVPLERFAEDLEALRVALQLDFFALAGLSMGGQIALEYYRQHPDRVRALLLLDTFATLDSPARRQDRLDTAAQLEQLGMAQHAREVLPKMVAPATLREQPAVAEAVLTMMQTTPPQGAAGALRGRAERRDYTSMLAKISVPTLVLVGRDDVFTPVADAVFMQERIAGAQLCVVEGAGHLPPMETPRECNAALNQFLRSCLT